MTTDRRFFLSCDYYRCTDSVAGHSFHGFLACCVYCYISRV